MHDARRKRLLHRARYRGFREADIVIGSFAEEAIASMPERELDAFEVLLSCADHDICAAVVEGAPPPAGTDPVLIARMRWFHLSRSERSET